MTEVPDPELAVFSAARRLPPDQRAAYLDEACAGDAALRQRVEELLQASEAVGAFLNNPESRPGVTVRLPIIPTEKPGDQIGRYKLLQQIGEGGCGVVYMAEQQEPVRRKVAIKVIKLGMDTKNVIARFEAERQALALMDHPNIAKVLDAAATDTGRPYFVMELVRGIKITDYCDGNKLSTAVRLELFIQVCQAIQHAHQKGIIHRDIKPSNILVADHDGVPVPKVIDFGIAKATTDQRLTDKTLFTAFEQFIGTPAYMSPEQARLSGLDIDTRSDVYSLGVLLYELLTAKTPFEAKRLHEIGLDEIRRIIREEEPLRPSARLHTLNAAEQTTVATHRQSEPPKLFGIISGDLDWIVMMCLEKDRSRRYETANGLAMDVHRFLTDEAVVARPSSGLYRLQKLVRRNRLAVFSGVLVTLSLVLGIALSTWQAVRATRAEREQRLLRQQAEAGRAAEAALRKIDDMRAQVASARVLFNAGKCDEAEKALQEIPASGRPEPEHAALLRLLGYQRADQGQWKEASADFSAVMRFNASDDAETVGEDFLRYGPALLESGDTNQYRRFVHETITRFAGTTDPLMAERVCKICLLMPADGETLRQLGAFYTVATNKLNELTDPHAKCWACMSLAIFEYRRGDYSKALEWGSITLTGDRETYLAVVRVIRAMSLQQVAHGPAGQDDFVQGAKAINAAIKKSISPSDIAFFDWMYCRILRREAAANFWPELATRQGLQPPKNSRYFQTLGHNEWNKAQMLREKGQLEQAEQVLREAVKVFEQGAIEYPDEPFMRQEQAFSHRLRGDLLEKLGRSDEAASECQAAIELYAGLKTAMPMRAFYWQEEAFTTSILAEIFEWAGQLEKAEDKYRQAIALHEQACAKFPYETVFAERLGTAKGALIALLCHSGRLPEAKAMCRDADERGSAEALNTLAWLLATSVQPNSRDGTNAVVYGEEAVAATHRKNIRYLDTLAAAYAEAGQFAKAINIVQEAMTLALGQSDARARDDGTKNLTSRLKLYENKVPYRNDGELAQLAHIRLREGKFAEAEQVARDCLAFREKQIPEDWRTFNAKSMLGGSLLGQKKYTEAGPLLLSGYEGMKQREASIPVEGKPRLSETLQRLVQLYEATAQPDQAAEWKKKLAEFVHATTVSQAAESK